MSTTVWRTEPVLLVHGGAWDIADELTDAQLVGIRAALGAGWAILRGGGSAVDAIEAAIVVLEDDEDFDAGRGSFVDQDGRVTCDAMFMDGSTLAAGAVAGATTIRNPVRAARRVMERAPQVYFVGEGADRFAATHGLESIANDALITDAERARWERLRAGHRPDKPSHDTVGAVALDAHGHLAAATSTGGSIYKPPGRVGDSSIIGSGGYADDELGAISCTGDGEAFMRLVLGKWALDRLADGLDAQAAAEAAIQRLARRLGGHGGLTCSIRRPPRRGLQHAKDGLGPTNDGGRVRDHGLRAGRGGSPPDL